MYFSARNVLGCLSLVMMTTSSYAGGLSQDHVVLELNKLARHSDYATTYLYNNNGTVNSSGDDIALGSTSRFDDDADLGYQLSGGKKLTDTWTVHVGLMSAEMDSQVTDTNGNNRLEIWRLPRTNELDSAQSVQAVYSSEWLAVEVSAVYAFSEKVDFFMGLGQLSLDEKFALTSDDIGTAGVGTYTINTGNDMQGFHVGVALNHTLANKFGLYLQGKLGWYSNDTTQSQQVTDSSFTRSNSGSSSEDSTVYDLRLGVNYALSKQLTLNLGYQVIDISNVALAETHFDTSDAGSNVVKDDDDLSWKGYNLGMIYRF